MKKIFIISTLLLPVVTFASDCESDRFMQEIAGPKLKKIFDTRVQSMDNLRKDNFQTDTQRALSDRASRIKFHKEAGAVCDTVFAQCAAAGLKAQIANEQLSWCRSSTEQIKDYEALATRENQLKNKARKSQALNESITQTRNQIVTEKLNKFGKNVVRELSNFVSKITRLQKDTQIPQQPPL